MRWLTVLLAAGVLLFSVGSGRALADAKKKKKTVTCGDIAVAMEESNGSLSAEEIAAKLHTSVKKVRQCWDQQEAPKKNAAPQTKPAN